MPRSTKNTRKIARLYHSDVTNACDGRFILTLSGRTPKGHDAEFKITIDYDIWPYVADNLRAAYSKHREYVLRQMRSQNEAFNLPPSTP